MSNKSDRIIDFAINNDGNITAAQAKKMLSGTYYCNGDKHVSDILSRLVKSGRPQRVSRGVFKLKSATTKVIHDHTSQQKIF